MSDLKVMTVAELLQRLKSLEHTEDEIYIRIIGGPASGSVKALTEVRAGYEYRTAKDAIFFIAR